MAGEEEQQRRGGISPITLARLGIRAKNIVTGAGAFFANPASAVFIGIGLLVFLSLFIIFFTPGGAAPLEISKEPSSEFGGTTSLNSCQFFRSGEGASFKSQKLLDYFQEASLKSGVPAALLAAIARVESPGSVNYTDETLPFDCKKSGLKSSTGALGIMQVSPPWAIKGYDAGAVSLGASYLGLKAEQLTEEDFCDPRENVFLAAGFIVKKMETLKYQPLGSGNDIKWNPDWTNNEKAIDNLATGYYGCLYYGGPDPSRCGIPPDYPHSYGGDLWKSLKSCRPSVFASSIAPQASSDYQTLHDQILKEFKVDFKNDDKGNPFHYDYLKWAWEKFWQIKSTRFLELVRGPENKTIIIKRDDSGTSQQTGCSMITMRGQRPADGSHYEEALFKVALLHELSHIIESCSPQARFEELKTITNSPEGYLTAYSGHSKGCAADTDPFREDYAETLAYFLNQEFSEQSYFASSLACPPPNNLTVNPYSANKSLHYKFAQELLIVPDLLAMNSASCPVENGKIYIPSFQANPTTGHCGQDYFAKAGNQQGLLCNGDSRQGKSIDVYTEGQNGKGPNGKDVVLPFINGQTLQWKLLRIDPLGDDLCFSDELLGYGCGNRLVFQADLGGGKNWTLHLTHLYLPSIKLGMGKTYPSGIIVGKSAPIHTHISVGKNIQDVMSADDSGWLSPDIQLKMCTSGV